MKRLTPRFRRWLFNRRRRQSRDCRKIRFELGPVTTLTGTFLVRLGDKAETPPSIFCFDQNYEETARFLSAIRRRSLIVMRGGMQWPTGKHRTKRPYLRRYHDFSEIQNISTSASLVLAAAYDFRRRLSGRNPFAIRLNEWNPEVRRTMRELGFFDLLEIERNVPNDNDPNRMILRFRAGAKVDPLQIDGPESVLESLFEFIGEDREKKVHLYTAVIEAMNNVRDHAYPEQYFRNRRHVKNWWFTGSADRISRKLTLSFYDQGISIPVSLPNSWDLKQLMTSMFDEFRLSYDPNNPKYDGNAIATAVRASETGTGLAHRGFGLAKIRTIVDGLPGGRLRILSRCGDYVAVSGNAPRIEICNTPLEGTLVEIEAAF